MKYFKNTSWLFAEKILRMIVGLFVGVWIARYLGPEQYGLLSYASSFVGLFTILATLGLDNIIVRELVNDPIRRDELLGTAYWLKLIGAIIVLIMLGIAIQFVSNDTLTNTLIIIIASSTLFQTFNVIDFYFQSKVLSRYIVIANTSSFMLTSLIKILLIINNAPLVAFAIAGVIDSIVVTIGLIFFYFHQGLTPKQWTFQRKVANLLLKESAPLIFAGFISTMYMKIDQVMIKEMLNETAVGYYAVAVKLSEVWFSLGVILCNSLFPAIINAKKKSIYLYYTRIQRLFLLLIVLAYIVAGIVLFAADFIITNLYGTTFSAAADVLKIHIFSSIFVYLGVSSGKWLINENLTLLNLYRNIIALITNIVLNVYLIQTYGLVGAAYASLISYFVAFYLFDILRSDTRRIFMLKTSALLLRRN